MRLLLYILLSILCLSCGNQNKQNKRISHSQIGKQMVFPEDIVYTRFLKNTIDYKIPENTKYKIVIYVDSLGCTECKLKLSEWKEFITHIDSISNKSVAFLFFYNLSDYRRVSFILKHENFDYPICVNASDQLNIQNNFRKGERNHTFLLDKDNQILAIGSPLHDPEAKDIYIGYITNNQKLLSLIENKTQIKIDNPIIDLGIVNKGIEKDVSFCLKNTGKNPLNIFNMETSCGCTQAEYDRNSALPGEQICIKVKVKAEYHGDFLETISIRCNTDEPVFVEIKGNIQ